MNPWGLIPLISFIVFGVLLVAALLQQGLRSKRVFVHFLFASAMWSFSSFMLVRDNSASSSYLQFWNVLVVAAIPWVAISYYHFIRIYDHRPPGISVYLGYAFVALLLILGLAGDVVRNVTLVGGFLHHDIKPWDYIIAIVLVPYLTATILILVNRYRRSTDPVDRNRTIYLITGWSLLLLISYITPFTPRLAGLPTDHLGNLANALLIAYAIGRYQLLDMKLIARRGLSYLFLGIILVLGYVSATLVAIRLFPAQQTSSIILFAALFVLVLAMVSRPLRTLIEDRIDRLFYQETYSSRLALLGFAARMSNILDLKELAKVLLPALTKSLNVSQVELLYQTNSDANFEAHFIFPEAEGEPSERFWLSVDSPVISWLDRSGRALHLDRLDGIPELKSMWQAEHEQLAAFKMAVLQPVRSRGRLVGILALSSKRSRHLFTNDDMELLSSIASQAGIVIENAQLYTEATIRANTDELTGLYNHRHFHERLDQEIARASRFGDTFSLIMMDMDLFKVYNDIYGHLAGNQLLKRIGHLLHGATRSIDLAFRYGGEEFAIILPGTRLEDAYVVAERIRKTIEARSSFREMPVTASLGVANWPADGIMKEEIINRADTALYRSKDKGRNRTYTSSDIGPKGTSIIGAELEAQPKALSIIYALAATVDAKDHYTYGHSRKVSEYAVAMGELLKLPADEVTNLRAAGLLHDIGKVGVPDSVLSKPGPLDEAEWAPIKSHPELGVEILRRVIDLVNCLPAILHHHEHFDGSGYPAGLKGESIPLQARILSIADAYDAMTSPRPYRNQLSLDAALDELRRCAGSQFDPVLVADFCQVMQETRRPEVSPAGDGGQV